MTTKTGKSLRKIILMLGVLGLIVTGEALAESTLVQVSPEDFREIEDIEALRVIDYKTFVFVELNPEQLKEVIGRGVEVQRQIDPNSFFIEDRRIDTTGSAPPIPLSAVATSNNSDFYLLQLIGPAKDAWLRELNAAGIETLRNFTPFVYLVKMTSVQLNAVNELEFVRWTGPYLPVYRLSSNLADMSGLIENVDISILAEGLEETLAAIEALGG